MAKIRETLKVQQGREPEKLLERIYEGQPGSGSEVLPDDTPVCDWREVTENGG